ncbi:DNA cytosine methyltransferase [uncultured Tateyamaria sp.]|uniref:DNA cytosine methyltransferase n=1 Tax=uncultured Tateyamaria sp. TaxID=455651 RepID=UPI00260DB951|nr:DNA cytosine methyltransferase [uncultured Tateyamaria sp.]
MTDIAPMIIDSFAGGGGASTGIELALGRSPDVAINHSAAALALHEANHPETLHLDSNIWDVEPREVTKGRHVGLMWASPDCKHFSKAKGGKPVDRNVRDLAWVIVKWAEEVKPDIIIMENVEEFPTWGPVGEDGQPVKEFAGITYNAWVKRFRRAGYKTSSREMRGCDFGDPTIRKRWFFIARRDGLPIAWPKPTHGDPKTRAVKNGKLKPWRTAAECIDWSLPCPSIFDTSAQIMDKHGLRAKRPLAGNTLARVARGMKRYVLDADEPFIVNLTHGARTEAASEPFRTITGANRGEKAVVAPSLFRHFGASTGARADVPAPTIVAGGGGKTGVVMPSLTRFNTGAIGSRIDHPAPTVTASSFIKRPGGAAPLGIVAPNLLSLKGTDRRASPIDEPARTVLAGGGHAALVSPVLTYAQHGGRSRAVQDPRHTITASKKDQNAAIIPTLIQTGYGERSGQAPRSLDPHAPLGTVVAGGIKHAAAAEYLAQHNKARQGVNPGRRIDAPISTVTQSGSQQNLVAPFFAKYYGTAQGNRTDDPCHTITVQDRFAHVQADLAPPAFGIEHEERAREVAEFMRAHGAWDGGEFVTLTIDGDTFVVVDIGLRMLTPRELFNAQGFPPDYVIEGVWNEVDGDWAWQPFTKSVQVSCCGNSVCPGLARALVEANATHLAVQREAA